MNQEPLAVLTDEAFNASELTYLARGTRFAVPFWRGLLWLSDMLGRVGRAVLVDGVGVATLGVVIAIVLLGFKHDWTAAIVVAGGWGVLLLLLTSWDARQRVLIGEFRNLLEPSTDGAPEQAAAVHLGDLLLGEISRIVDLFQVVGDRRAVSSGLGPERAFDATMSSGGLLGTLRGAVSPDSKVSVGPITLPVAPLVALLGTILKAPRLTGGLHRDGNCLILTAEMSRRRGLTWIVTRRLPEASSEAAALTNATAVSGDGAIVSSMVRQLSLRVFTDVALGRSVRWNATQAFVAGLQAFRVCLRTPRDRKVNLKTAQEQFLRALGEDEDFPLAHYNLGVVYTELHGLAIAGGRDREAAEHLRAAETAFGKAIEKDPTRWETYFAYAQTQYRYERYERVTELARRIDMLRTRGADRAKVAELEARALNRLGKEREANNRARAASQSALLALAGAQFLRKGSVDSDVDRESSYRELAAGCLLTFANIFSTQTTPAEMLSERRFGRWRQDRILRRAQEIFKLARALTRRGADMRFEFGMLALRRGRLDIAAGELEAAARSEPTRPVYLAGLALAYARRHGQRPDAHADGSAAADLCWETLEAMAAAYNPARDQDACAIAALALEEIGDHERAKGLTELAETIRNTEGRAAIEGIISAHFLHALEQRGDHAAVRGRGQFVRAIAEARNLLKKYSEDAVAAGRSPDGSPPPIGQLRDALREADRATSLNPLSSLAWETLGDVYRMLSDFERARESWQNALTADPDNPDLYNKIGWSFWYSAFEKAARVSRDDLGKAARQFENALLVYGTECFSEQVLTHYRLGKLKAQLREFADARSELRIVENMATDRPPVVGWVQLGLAYLERDQYPECEYFCGRAANEGSRLAANGHSANVYVGDILDEATWPLGVVRAWAHLGIAFSLLKRDGDLDLAADHVSTARKAIAEVDRERHPSRASAACDDADGEIDLRRNQMDRGIEKLRSSLSAYPFSTVYVHLALALAKRAGQRRSSAELEEARRLIRHARTLRPPDAPARELDEAEQTLALLASGNGAADA